MTRSWVIELVALYWPIILIITIQIAKKPTRKVWAAAMIASIWQAASIPWLNDLAMSNGWWKFNESTVQVVGMPISLYLSWVLLWGVAAVLLLGGGKLRYLFLMVIGLGVLDIVTMSHMEPLLELQPDWWMGELIFIGGALLPGVMLARLVIRGQGVLVRAHMIAFSFVLLLIGVMPRACDNLIPWAFDSDLSPWLRFILLGLLMIFSVPGYMALYDFAREGNGTPIPFDPPRKLVESGVYAYVVNPMQLSIFVILVIYGFLMQSWTCFLLAAMSVIYSEGFAQWSEKGDMEKRFGQRYSSYKAEVPRWRFRLLPRLAKTPAILYVELRCDHCQNVGNWFSRQLEKYSSNNLKIKPAASFPSSSLARITYISSAGEHYRGVSAVARSLGHLHLGWAWLGWMILLPGVAMVAQCAMDAVGGGKVE